MPLSRRYMPEKPPEEVSLFGMDFSFVLPPGVGIQNGELTIFSNTQPPVAADTDFSKGPVSIRGRTTYCPLGGGVVGKDYQLRWTAHDTEGNSWTRTGLILCANTS